MKFLSKRSVALALTSMMLMLTACSSSDTTDAQTSQEGYPVTVENCGTHVTFDSPPLSVSSFLNLLPFPH